MWLWESEEEFQFCKQLDGNAKKLTVPKSGQEPIFAVPGSQQKHLWCDGERFTTQLEYEVERVAFLNAYR